MPISICLPAGEIYASQQAPELRAFGDPGTTEQFALPNYIYIYIVTLKENGDKTHDDDWILWETITKSVDDTELGNSEQARKAAWEAKWEKKRYAGTYDTQGDYVYQYTETIDQMLGGKGVNGRVYVVASAVQLTLSPAISKDANNPSTLADLLSLTFSFNGSTEYDNNVKANLQNIYSTPYNYYGGGSEYYGTFYATQNVPHFNLLLYHVAAKVDLMWNVKEEIRDEVKLSYIAADSLYNGPCYLFKPTENTIGNNRIYPSGYTKVLLESLSPGTQWNGRDYFYAIPYKNNDKNGNNESDPHYPLKLRLQKNNDSSTGNSYYSTIVKTEVGDKWTSWLRGQITINTETYNVKPN